MPFFYSIFGLGVRANLPIACLLELHSKCHADVEVSFQVSPAWLKEVRETPQEPFYISSELNDRRNPTVRVWKLASGAYFRILYDDGTEFILDRSGGEIWTTWLNTSTLEDTVTYLVGPVLAFVLRLRGMTCLHASAVAIDDQAIALLGPAGAGKSTTAAAFARLGYPVLSDDVVPLVEQDGNFLALPGYPRLNLWPESVSALYGSPDALPLMTPNWNKRYVALNDAGHRFQSEPLPLAAIYFLGERVSDPPSPMVQSMASASGMIALVAHTYVNYLLDERMRTQEFELLGRVMNRVPLRRVTPHTDTAQLPKLCQSVIHDVRASCSTAVSVENAKQNPAGSYLRP